MLQWLGQLQTVNFVQNAKYTIEYVYSGVQCSTIDATLVQDHVVGGLNREGLGFSYISPPVVSQSGPNQCSVRLFTERVDATTLFDVGPTGPFSGVPNAKLNAVLDESGKDLFRAPAATPPPTQQPPPPMNQPPAATPISEKKTSPIVYVVAGALAIGVIALVFG
jgi:hypothetical protein